MDLEARFEELVKSSLPHPIVVLCQLDMTKSSDRRVVFFVRVQKTLAQLIESGFPFHRAKGLQRAIYERLDAAWRGRRAFTHVPRSVLDLLRRNWVTFASRGFWTSEHTPYRHDIIRPLSPLDMRFKLTSQ